MEKLMGAALAMMVALALSGVAYACWEQTIYVEGEIETGELCVGFTAISCNDEGIDPGHDKDVGYCECWLEEQKCEWPACEYAEIYIGNAYPCYSVTVTVEITNCGSIPVNLADCDFEIGGDLAPWVEVYFDGDWPGYPQIDPEQTVQGYINIHIAQLDEYYGECPMNATASITVYAHFCQWNEICVQ